MHDIPNYEPLTIKNSLLKSYNLKDSLTTTNKPIQFEKQAYIDHSFPSNQQSIGGNYQCPLYWLRPSQFMEKPCLFSQNTPLYCNIIQGDLCNEYLISSLNALAEKPESLYQLFPYTNANEQGHYIIQLYWKGIKTHISIDDKFPIKKATKTPCFTRSKENELWVFILEKAWAKLHNSYSNIDAGLVKEIMHDLTGAPCRSFSFKEIQEEDIKIRVQNSLQKNYIVLCECKKGKMNVQRQNIGQLYQINNTHGYTILQINAKYVKLRNGWCKSEWRPNQLDEFAKQIPKNVKEEMQYSGRSQGIFLMNWNDFYAFFTNIYISYYLEQYKYTSINVMKKKQNFLKIKIKKQGLYYFQLSQQSIRTQNIRFQMNTLEQDYYDSCFICICDFNSNPVLQIQGNQRDLTSFQYIDNPFIFMEGEYQAFMYVQQKEEEENYFQQCGFGIYGETFAEIQLVQKQMCEEEFQNYIESIIQSY